MVSAARDALSERAYESRAFALWQRMLGEIGGRRVVDFGRLRPGTLNHFSAGSVNLEVVAFDLRQVEEERLDAEGEATPKRAADQLESQLPRPDSAGAVDGALCWDIPNYLSREELARLGDWLSHYCASGAPLFVALATRNRMPARPGSYQVLDDERLAVDEASDTAKAPMYSHNDLKRMWPDFDVVRSFLLQDGRQEYVLKRY